MTDKTISAKDKEATTNFLKRNFNAISDPDLVTKKSASTEIFNFLQANKQEFDSIFIEQIMNTFGKQILKAMSDNAEKVRENSAKILNFLLSRCQEFTPHLSYIVSILTERTNCHDLEGIQDLPEIMRPAPSQKPHVHVKLSEPTEEIRLEYCETISTIISCCNEDEIRGYINDIVNILRALAMDPCGEVQVKACQSISQLCRTFNNLLLHFSEILARALLLPLVNKKSKVRIAALEALGQVLYCGVWKYNNTIMEVLVGFRDPNSVPINNFFEYSININYFAILVKDAKSSVREFFIRSLGDWLISLPDRYDHEPRLVPYLVSGLYDNDEEICKEAYEIIEEIGLQYEREKEKEFRSIKQFAYESEWTQGGKVKDIKFPKPIEKRPRLGARFFIKNHIRKFLPALYKEVKDWKFENRYEAINLLLFGLIYTEEYVTQFLDKMIVNILHNFNVKNKEDQKIADKTSEILYYIGLYCNSKSYLPIIMSALKGEISDYEDATKFGLMALVPLFKGFFETVIKDDGLGEKRIFIYEILDFLSEKEFLAGIDKETAPIIEEILQTLLDSLLEKCNSDDLEAFYKEKRLQAQEIAYVALRFRIVEFESKVAKLNFDTSFRPELILNITANNLVKALDKLDGIFEDLLLDSFIEQFASNHTGNNLSLTEWKIVYTYLLINLSQYQSNDSKNDDAISKTLALIKKVDLKSYAKTLDVLQMNVFLIKLISDTYSDQELSSQQSSILSHLIDMSCKTYSATEKLASQSQGLKEKLLYLNESLFSRNIIWVDAAQKYEGKTEQTKEFCGNVAELLHQILNTTLRKEEGKGKEFKTRLSMFNNILGHLGALFVKKSRYLQTLEGKYLVPELIEYVIFLHEKFAGDDPENIQPLLFEPLFTVLMPIPDSLHDTYQGDDWIVKDFPKVLEQIIVLAIDAKDNETKGKYKAILKSFCKKTPFTILDLWEKAAKSQSIPRVELLASLKGLIEG